MSKERKLFIGLFGVAAAGLAADRTILAPASASASGTSAQAAGPPGVLAELTESIGQGVRGSVQKALGDVLANSVDQSLGENAESLRFGPAPEWLASADPGPADEPGIDLSVTASDLTRTPARPEGSPTPGLTMVMPTSGGGIAMIDGVRLRVGQRHPSGFLLLSVGDRTATIEIEGERTVLAMPIPR